MRAAVPTAFPTAGLAASRLRPPRPRRVRRSGREPCGGETVIDFALCLILAVATVGLLLLALRPVLQP